MKVSTIVNRFIKKNKNTLFLITLVLILFVIVFYLYKNVHESFNNQATKTVEHKRFDSFTISMGEEGEKLTIQELNNSGEHPFHLYDTHYVKKDEIINVKLNTTIDDVINNSKDGTNGTNDTKGTKGEDNKSKEIDVEDISFISGKEDIQIDKIVYTLNKNNENNKYEFYGSVEIDEVGVETIDLNNVIINENSFRKHLINDNNIISKIKQLLSTSLTEDSNQIVSKFIDMGINNYNKSIDNITTLLNTLKEKNQSTTKKKDKKIRISISDFSNIEPIINAIKEIEKDATNSLIETVKSIHKSLNDNDNTNANAVYSTTLNIFMSSNTYNDIFDLIFNFIKERVFPEGMLLTSKISHIKSALFTENFKTLVKKSYEDNTILEILKTIKSGENNATKAEDVIIPTEKSDIPIYIHITKVILDYLIAKFNDKQRYPLGIFTLLPFLLYKDTDNGIIPDLVSIYMLIAIFRINSEDSNFNLIAGSAVILSLYEYEKNNELKDIIPQSLTKNNLEPLLPKIQKKNINDIRSFFNFLKEEEETDEAIPLIKIMENCFNILVKHDEEHKNQNHNH